MRDMYGRLRSSQDIDDTPVPYQTVSTESGSVVTSYTRYYDEGAKACGIVKETVDSSTAGTVSTMREFAFAPWADRLTATYVSINDCWTIQ